MDQDIFDSLEIGHLMARYARLQRRVAKLLIELEDMKRLIRENV